MERPNVLRAAWGPKPSTQLFQTFVKAVERPKLLRAGELPKNFRLDEVGGWFVVQHST